jgi:hypothetical protein
MEEPILAEVKDVINVITIFQPRVAALRKDLQFLLENADKPIGIGALKRLEHEVMFLCIDAYSLHQGISKKRSLYSKIIKQNTKTFLKVDRRPTHDSTNVIHLGYAEEGGIRKATPDEVENLVKASNQEAVSSRNALQKEVGIQSQKSSEMDDWINSVVDEDILAKLSEYRTRFAHRLDSLDNLKQELEVHHPQSLQEMLSVVAVVLEQYKSCFQKILKYTTSIYYAGSSGFEYDSLARIRQWKKLEPILRKSGYGFK